MAITAFGRPVAILVGGGLAFRALGQMGGVVGDLALPRQLATPAILLYCLAFAYALLRQGTAFAAAGLHLGAAAMVAGAIVDAMIGRTAFGLALSGAGAAMLVLALWRAAGRRETKFQRASVLVASAGPAMFGLHAAAYQVAAEALPARFLRLGATAAMALPLLAALYRDFQPVAATRATRFARVLLDIGMVAMPLVLLLAAFVDERLKFATAPASDCLTLALIVASAQAWRRAEIAALAGFGVLLVSMVLGKLMGFYSFDGPLAPPTAIGAYGDPWRTALRHFHIDLMVLGFSALLWPSLVRSPVVVVALLALALGLAAPALGAWSALSGVVTLAWAAAVWRSGEKT